MAITALIFGILGGLCAVVGIVNATTDVIPSLGAEITTIFWLVLSAILLLGSIAASVSRSNYD